MNYIAFGEFITIVSEKRKKRPHGVPPNWCPFCPGNEHLAPPAVLEVKEGDRWIIRVIPNKFPAVSPKSEEAYGYHEVVVETPEHGKTFWLHPVEHITRIIDVWGKREESMYADERIQYVAIFKNWGTRAGASIPHGHSQIIGIPFVPPRVREKEKGIRQGLLVWEGEFWEVHVPKTPRFAYEVHILPKEPFYHVYELTPDARLELASLLKRLIAAATQIVDAYNFFVFTSPRNGKIPVHVEIYPRKNVHAGFELGTGAYIVPVSPERAREYYAKALQG